MAELPKPKPEDRVLKWSKQEQEVAFWEDWERVCQGGNPAAVHFHWTVNDDFVFTAAYRKDL